MLALAATAAGVAALYAAGLAVTGAGLVTLPRGDRGTAAVVDRPVGIDALPPAATGRYITVATALELDDLHLRAGFSLAAVRAGNADVPRLLVAAMPADFAASDDSAVYKPAFLRTALPLVLEVNERLRAERRELERLAAQRRAGRSLGQQEQRWLARLAERYRTAPDDLAELRLRVDAVLPSVAIAQAIQESGWGRSRYALEGNALFGQRTWSQGAGIVPQERNAGQRHEVKAFARLIDSVRAYAMNLNTHAAYGEYRRLRAAARAAGRLPDARALAAALDAYSEGGAEYVASIVTLLRIDRLTDFDRARLSPVVTAAVRDTGPFG